MSFLPVAACCAASLFVHLPVASAQAGALPCTLVQEPAPTPAQIDQIRDTGTALARKLATTTDEREIERARRDLLRPFNGCSDQSVAFRNAYSKVVAFELRDITRGEDIHRAVNALQALGPIGTSETTDLVLDALGDSRDAIRLGAACAVADCIQGDTRVSLLREPALQAMAAAGAALEIEEDPAIASALVSALAVSNANQTMLRAAAIALAERLPERIGDLEEGFDVQQWSRAIAKAAATQRAGVLNANTRQPEIATEVRRVTRGSAATIGYVLRVLEETEDLTALSGTPTAEALKEIMASASSQIQLAARTLDNSNSPTVDLNMAYERAMEAGDPSVLAEAIEKSGPILNGMGVGDDAFRPGG